MFSKSKHRLSSPHPHTQQFRGFVFVWVYSSFWILFSPARISQPNHRILWAEMQFFLPEFFSLKNFSNILILSGIFICFASSSMILWKTASVFFRTTHQVILLGNSFDWTVDFLFLKKERERKKLFFFIHLVSALDVNTQSNFLALEFFTFALFALFAPCAFTLST